eukprot:g4698.t1
MTAAVTIFLMLDGAAGQTCQADDQETETALQACKNEFDVVFDKYQQEKLQGNPHSGLCQALNVYHSCVCQIGNSCTTSEGSENVNKVLIQSTAPICTQRAELANGSPAQCKPVLDVVCDQGKCGTAFGGSLSPNCANALNTQFSQPKNALRHPAGFYDALKGLQGLQYQTNYVVDGGKSIPGGGVFVPACSRPTDFWVCKGKTTTNNNNPQNAVGDDDQASQDHVYCLDAGEMDTTEQADYKKRSDRMTDLLCDRTSQPLITQQFGGDVGSIKNPNTGQQTRKDYGRCCDRPLKPGQCIDVPDPSGEKNKQRFRCAKRWLGTAVQNFKKQCESSVDGSVDGVPYGTAYFLSAQAVKQVGETEFTQQIIDANVLCWPSSRCLTDDLEQHLRARATECTKNFMDQCTYTARPIECNLPTADNVNCAASITTDQSNDFKKLTAQWQKLEFGYTICDDIYRTGGVKNCATAAGKGAVQAVVNPASALAPTLSALLATAILAAAQLCEV